MSNSRKRFFLFIIIVMLSDTLSAQVTWDFTSAAASATVTNITAGSVTQGNNNGSTTFIGAGAPASTGYTGASGGNNGSVSAKTGTVNTGTSSYVQVTLTPASGYAVQLTHINWANYSVSTSGPSTLSVYTSIDNYSTAIATVSAVQNATWALLSPAITPLNGKKNEVVTVRIYASAGTGSTPAAGTANWRVDDLKISATPLPILESIYVSMQHNGSTAAASPWNSISGVNTPTLANGSGTATQVGLEFPGSGWSNTGNEGNVTGNNSGVYPDDVIRDYYWFGNYGAPETINMTIKNLDPTSLYNIQIFGSSKWTSVPNNGTTVYSINGVPKPLNVHQNTQNVVNFLGILPTASGNIVVNLSKGVGAPYGLISAFVLEKIQNINAIKSWDYNGNTVAATKTIGTIDNFDLPVITNNTERMRVTATGNVGIGTTSPAAKLHVTGNTLADGKLGIGNFTPSFPLEVDMTSTSTLSNQTALNIKNINIAFDANRQGQLADIPPTIGYNGTDGLTWYNDGYNLGMGLVQNKKLIAYGYSTVNSKSFRLPAAFNNYQNYSLEILHTDATYSNPNNVWTLKPNSSAIISYEHPLNIGTMSAHPLRFFADPGSNNKIADIFIHDSRIGIGTETPNANAKLDVAGNLIVSNKIGIGTTNITSNDYKLFVEGKIRARKVRVDADVWPDYVFDSTYKMPTLRELETFIQKNKHLPDVTPAKQAEKEGIDIGDNQAMLLRKIEELTLYIIEINKKIEALGKENAELKNAIQNNK